VPREQVIARLDLLQQPNWTLNQIEDHFGASFQGERYRLLQQFLIWDRQQYEASLELPATINRLKFELFLQNNQWISKRNASLVWAMTPESFDRTLKAAAERFTIGEHEANGVYPDIFTADFVKNFFKRIPTLRSKVFPDVNVFYARFHEEVKKFFDVEVEPVKCVTSIALGQDNYGYIRDILTDKPMAAAFSVFLNTSKPIQLRPDTTSLLTYFAHEELIEPLRIGHLAGVTSGQIELLKEYARTHSADI
jgi:hypothetical protein